MAHFGIKHNCPNVIFGGNPKLAFPPGETTFVGEKSFADSIAMDFNGAALNHKMTVVPLDDDGNEIVTDEDGVIVDEDITDDETDLGGNE